MPLPTHSDSGPEEIILRGIGVSPGIAIGPVGLGLQVFELPEIEPVEAEEGEREVTRLAETLAVTRKQIEALRDRISAEAGTGEADIFDAHLLMLEDRSLIDEVQKRMRRTPQRAEGAFWSVMSRYIESIRRIDDEYLRERVVDIEDVARRVVRNLRGHSAAQSHSRPHLLLSEEVSPSETAAMDRANVLGFATEAGSHTSHSAIMARSMGIPAVVGLPDITSRFHTGQTALLDGYQGLLIINPRPETMAAYEGTRRIKARLELRLREMTALPASTADGQRVVLAGNIEFEHEVESVRSSGGLGVGLYRTEFFYLNRADLPDEEEQTNNYSRVAAAAGPEGVIIRTLDIGGDKLHHHIHEGLEESNPFLGWRGIRVSLNRSGVFRTQLRAILRASAAGKVRVMFPMISSLQELRAARSVLHQCMEELDAARIPYDPEMEIGAMIEVPSAAVCADALAAEVDFFSIGTNDLIQYTIAVDRGNELVANLYQPAHPAILRLMHNTATAARNAGIWCGVCGEMAGDVLFTPFMVGLGFHELSMGAAQLPRVKFAIRHLDASACRELVDELLTLTDAAETAARLEAMARKCYPELMD